MPRVVKKSRRAGTGSGNCRSTGGRSGENEDPLYVDFDQRMRTLQTPAACSVVFGMIERYVRSLSSHEPLDTALPSKGSLLTLIDSHIIKLPSSSDKMGDSSLHRWPFTVFEELELLELLRVQIEERPSLEIQLALFDSLFGLADRSSQHVEQCVTIMKKLVSLCISMGCTTVLQCVACWMELYPGQSMDLSRFVYFEFCELLPDAKDPLWGLCSVCPALARLLTYHLSVHYDICDVKTKISNDISKSCPPLPLFELVSHWISTNPDYIFVKSILVETREDYFLLRSKKPRSLTPSPLKGLVQWCVMEPLLSDSALSVRLEHASRLRVEVSKLHANILTSLSTSANSLLSVDELTCLVEDLLYLIKLTNIEGNECIEKSIDRFAQTLQIGLSVGSVHPNTDGLASVLSELPQNRLMKIVITRHRKTPRIRDH